MKKVILIVAAVIVVVVVAVAFFASGLDSIVQKAIETLGPKLTQTTVTVAGVSLSPSSGSGELRNLIVGNPDGYQSPHAIQLGRAKLALDPKSVLSDKVHITSIAVTDPVITIEGGIGDNNLKKILANVQSFTGGDKAKPAAGGSGGSAQKKLQVDDFTLSGAQVEIKFSLLGGKGLTVPIPDIHLSNLGAGPDGITPGDLTQKVIGSIYEETIAAAGKAVAGAAGNVGDAAKSGLDKAAKGIGDLFKR